MHAHTHVHVTCVQQLFVVCQVAAAKDLKFVGTDAFEDFYELQQLKTGGKVQRNTGGSSLLKEKIMREAEVRSATCRTFAYVLFPAVT